MLIRRASTCNKKDKIVLYLTSIQVNSNIIISKSLFLTQAGYSGNNDKKLVGVKSGFYTTCRWLLAFHFKITLKNSDISITSKWTYFS